MASGPTGATQRTVERSWGWFGRYLEPPPPQRQLKLAKLFEQVISRSELNFRRVGEKSV